MNAAVIVMACNDLAKADVLLERHVGVLFGSENDLLCWCSPPERKWKERDAEIWSVGG